MPPSGFEPPVLIALVRLDHNATILCVGDKDYIDRVELDMPVEVFVDGMGRFCFRPQEPE